MNRHSRRAVLAGIAASTLALAAPGHAQNEQRAEALVRQAVDEITRVINSGRPEGQIYRDFEAILVRYADMPTIAQYSLGADARGVSSAQLRSFTQAFQGYLARKYGKRFREFIGGSVEVTRSRTDRSFVVVESVARLRGQSPIAVDFYVSDRSGRDKLFNVVIEGVNLLTTERTEIGALLDQQGGSIDRLTTALTRIG